VATRLCAGLLGPSRRAIRRRRMEKIKSNAKQRKSQDDATPTNPPSAAKKKTTHPDELHDRRARKGSSKGLTQKTSSKTQTKRKKAPYVFSKQHREGTLLPVYSSKKRRASEGEDGAEKQGELWDPDSIIPRGRRRQHRGRRSYGVLWRSGRVCNLQAEEK